jgi:alkylated DNA nucleotide flippase Atl1
MFTNIQSTCWNTVTLPPVRWNSSDRLGLIWSEPKSSLIRPERQHADERGQGAKSWLGLGTYRFGLMRGHVASAKGRVSSYGRAAGYPLHHRGVARLLRRETLTALPWQRILGSDGEIRTKGEFAEEQRMRLKMEAVKIEGQRVNMAVYEHTFICWDA